MNLKRLRSAPQHVKTRYAFLIALSLTFLITGIWATSLPARFANLGGTINTSGENTANVVGSATDTFTEFFDSTKAGFTNVINEQGVPSEGTNSSTNVYEKPLYDLRIESDETTSSESETSTAVTPSPESPQPTEEEVQPAPVVNNEPRVILIGTTTSKRAD